MVDLKEPSEEIRMLFGEIVTLIVSTTVWDCVRPYIDSFVAICRALCMDPSGVVIMEGCQAMQEFAISG